MAKLTKTQAIAALAEATEMSKTDVKAFLETYEALALKEVKENGEFPLMNLGKFIKQNRAARMGRNPATGEAIQIAAKTVVKFRLSKATKDSVL